MKDEGRELESREKCERLLASGLLVLAGPTFFDVSAAGWDQECVPERELLPNRIKTVGRAEWRNKGGAERKARMKGDNGAKRLRRPVCTFSSSSSSCEGLKGCCCSSVFFSGIHNPINASVRGRGLSSDTVAHL